MQTIDDLRAAIKARGWTGWRLGAPGRVQHWMGVVASKRGLQGQELTKISGPVYDVFLMIERLEVNE